MGKHFGAKLASCMAVRGWVDDAVAQKLVSPKTGRAYNRSHIANLRNGKVEPSEMLVAQLERIFGGDDGAALRAAWVTEQTPPGAREALEAERKARVAAEAEVLAAAREAVRLREELARVRERLAMLFANGKLESITE